MSLVNNVRLIGHLGADPEMHFLDNGSAICEMRLATTEKWTKDGQKHEKTEWHRLKAFGKLAEICGQYLNKGSKVAVEGRLTTRTWDDKKTGDKKYATEIVLDGVEFLSSNKGSEKPKEDFSDEGDSPF